MFDKTKTAVWIGIAILVLVAYIAYGDYKKANPATV